MWRLVKYVDAGGDVVRVVYLWETDAKSRGVVLVVCVAVQIEEP